MRLGKENKLSYENVENTFFFHKQSVITLEKHLSFLMFCEKLVKLGQSKLELSSDM